jgi:hypothetical protein
MPEVAVYFEKRDIWVGIFVDPQPDRLTVYVCLVPCVPIRLTWRKIG